MQSERLTLNCKHGHMTFSCEKMLCRLIVLPVLQHSLTAAYEVVATFVFMYMHLVFSRLKGEKKSTIAQIDRVTWMWEITGVAVVGGMGQIAEIGSRDMRGCRNCEGCRDGRDCKGCNGCRNRRDCRNVLKKSLLVYLLTHPANPNDGTDHSVHHNWRENHGDQSGTLYGRPSHSLCHPRLHLWGLAVETQQKTNQFPF